MKKILGNGMTTDAQLNKVGKKLFGSRWIGVFSSDVKPTVLMPKTSPTGLSMGIINVDGKYLPGSHWLGIIYDGSKWYIYDSFNRRSKKLIPKFIKMLGYNYVDTNSKADQKNSEDNCGSRVMAFLLFVKRYGIHRAHVV